MWHSSRSKRDEPFMSSSRKMDSDGARPDFDVGILDHLTDG